MKRKLLLMCVVLLSAGLVKSTEFMPAENVFKPLTADLTWPSFNTRATVPVGAKNLAEVNMGDEFAIVRFGEGDSFIQAGIMGGVAARFNISRITNDLQIADYTLAFPFDYVKDNWVLRIMYWHTSSHIGDDYIKANSILPAALEKNVTDDVRVLFSSQLFNRLRVYKGYIYSFNTIPDTDKPHGLQGGFDLEKYLTAETETAKILFLACNVKALQKLGWQPSVSVRSGIKFKKQKSSFTVFTGFFAGHMPYLGFQNKKETNWSFGLNFEM